LLREFITSSREVASPGTEIAVVIQALATPRFGPRCAWELTETKSDFFRNIILWILWTQSSCYLWASTPL